MSVKINRKRALEQDVHLEDMLYDHNDQVEESEAPAAEEEEKNEITTKETLPSSPSPVVVTAPEADPWNEIAMMIDSIITMTALGSMRCALPHQLYASYENKTFVDREISTLREQGVLRALHSSVGTILMKTQDYMDDVDQHTRASASASSSASLSHRCASVFKYWSVNCDQTSLTQQRLLDGAVKAKGTKGTKGNSAEQEQDQGKFKLSQGDVDLLVSAGFLLHRRDANVSALWFHHPRLGITSSNILSTRKQIVAAVRRNRFDEMTDQQIAKLRLKQTGAFVPFALDFSLKDLCGFGSLRLFRGASGARIYRLS